MAEKTEVRLDEEALRQFVLRSIDAHRFLQESPVLPDVWVECAKRAIGEANGKPGAGAYTDLLIIPHNRSDAATVAHEILLKLRSPANRERAEVAFLRSEVAAHLKFSEVFQIVLPMTDFWQYFLCREDKTHPGDTVMNQMLEAANRRIHSRDNEIPLQKLIGEKDRAVLWRFIILSGIIAYLESGSGSRESKVSVINEIMHALLAGRATPKSVEPLYGPLKQLWNKAPKPDKPYQPNRDQPTRGAAKARKFESEGVARVWSVNLNRRVSLAMDKARCTVKADAVERLFNSNSATMTWAIVDAGIDARHPAFAQRDKHGQIPDSHWDTGYRIDPQWSRIKGTFDFTNIRKHSAALLRSNFDARQESLRPDNAARQDALKSAADAAKAAQKVMRREPLDWKELLPLIEISHEPKSYRRPDEIHGTHVAGILGGYWKKDPPEPEDVTVEALAVDDRRSKKKAKLSAKSQEPMGHDIRRRREGNDYANDIIGIAPSINILDLRILADSDEGREFAVIAALQFISYLNRDRSVRTVHGVNISLQLPSSVQNYACGQTPVCLECDRIVSEGTVVVAAAGNHGFESLVTKSSDILETHMPISISDPGNAASVITVGSTHRESPHTYGVSYFSSRGPTGDGRLKPDLLAPGEKIFSCIPLSDAGVPRAVLLDGTSMAAPHVSGAAALLMSRNPELIGRPQRIKEILMQSATDLGRDRYFQGAGLVDILRALQSV